MKRTYNQSDISDIAKNILEISPSRILLFYGAMGVGKTTLIKEMATLLGAKEEASSPSFSIVNEYEISNGLIYHFDFYRIESIYEAMDLGIEEYLYSGEYVFIEWPEKIAELLPADAARVEIDKNDDGSRTIRLEAGKN